MGETTLLRSRRFAPFFWTQFQGALNDNVFKNALVILFAFGAASSTLSTDTLVNIAGGVFILPFFLFGAPAGQQDDKDDDAAFVLHQRVRRNGRGGSAAPRPPRRSVQVDV